MKTQTLFEESGARQQSLRRSHEPRNTLRKDHINDNPLTGHLVDVISASIGPHSTVPRNIRFRVHIALPQPDPDSPAAERGLV